MKNKLLIGDARMLLKMMQGEGVPASSLSRRLSDDLLAEGLLFQQVHGSRRKFILGDSNALTTYLAQRYGIQVPIGEWITIMDNDSVSRAEQIVANSSSKTKSVRTFRGFLAKSYLPIETIFRGKPFLFGHSEGMSIFVEDYEHFRLAKDVTVVGIENGENFQHIGQMRYLFDGMKILFVSRYPQSSDLRFWLQSIPNPYLHFVDFDLAGINIFLTEFYAYLGPRATFFIPPDIETRLQNGNSSLYDRQYSRYSGMKVKDARLQPLVDLIHRYRRVYEQEGYLVREES